MPGGVSCGLAASRFFDMKNSTQRRQIAKAQKRSCMYNHLVISFLIKVTRVSIGVWKNVNRECYGEEFCALRFGKNLRLFGKSFRLVA